MGSNMKSLLAFGLGFAGGWAARSLADSPQGVGVKLLEMAIRAKERVGKWVAVERENLEDMVAEARTRVEPEILQKRQSAIRSGSKIRSVGGQA